MEKVARGRPPATPAQRKKRLAAAVDYHLRRLSLSQVARLHGISKTTAYEWVSEAVRYDDPEAEALRRLCDLEDAGG